MPLIYLLVTIYAKQIKTFSKNLPSPTAALSLARGHLDNALSSSLTLLLSPQVLRHFHSTISGEPQQPYSSRSLLSRPGPARDTSANSPSPSLSPPTPSQPPPPHTQHLSPFLLPASVSTAGTARSRSPPLLQPPQLQPPQTSPSATPLTPSPTPPKTQRSAPQTTSPSTARCPLSYPDPHGQGATWPSRLARRTARSRARHTHCSQPTRLHDGNLLCHSSFSSQDNITHIPHQGTPPNLIFSPCWGEI